MYLPQVCKQVVSSGLQLQAAMAVEPKKTINEITRRNFIICERNSQKMVEACLLHFYICFFFIGFLFEIEVRTRIVTHRSVNKKTCDVACVMWFPTVN